jgi:DNA-binding winged helix-turn-helix (wHTH) protein
MKPLSRRVLTVSFGFLESFGVAPERPMKIRFARCRLDTDSRRLFRGPREVHLSPKAFELLRVLVENRDRALSKAELLDKIWPGIFVSDMSLARVVTEVRQAVGDRARRAQIIRTVHAHGYAFVADVKDEVDAATTTVRPPEYWLTTSTQTFPLQPGEHIVGRDPASTIWLDSPKVSRRHARVSVREDQVVIEDLGTKNGTYVRGERLSGTCTLEPSDEILIGPFRMRFRVSACSPTTETEAVER